MKFVNESGSSKKCYLSWCGTACPPMFFDVAKGPKGSDPELEKMDKEFHNWLTSTKSATADEFTAKAREIASSHGWECIWDYTLGSENFPAEMQQVQEQDCQEETERIDGGVNDAVCQKVEEDYKAGDIQDFIGSKAANRHAKVMVKESGQFKSLKDIYFKNGKCIIEIG